MAIRLRLRIETAISSTTAEDRDLGNGAFEVVVDDPGEGGSWKTHMPAGTTDQQVALPNIASAQFLLVRTTARDQNETPVELSFKLNSSGGEEISVSPLGASKEGYLLLTSAGITALYCTNAGAVDMDIMVYAAGD